MKKTLTILAAVAALGTGIITAQAETGYDANESANFQTSVESSTSANGSDIFLTNDGHSL